jgi:hypothetical protein
VRHRRRAVDDLRRVLDWYFERRYGKTEGPGTVPFYCDRAKVGAFAVSPHRLARGEEAATFRLFVTLAMFQALRDVVVMRRQRSLTPDLVEEATSLPVVREFKESGRCPGSLRETWLTAYCDIWKRGGRVDCDRHPGLDCCVKSATRAFNRMADLGKLPASAYVSVWAGRGLRGLMTEILGTELSPARRAEVLVDKLQTIHRIGRKLATMFVSALSTPAIAPGLSPWYPEVDGNALAVIDTNVARAVDALRRSRGSASYASRESWVREQASQLDLREFDPALPAYSPRIVQQALYSFASRSNRSVLADECQTAASACASCVPRACPFARRGAMSGVRGSRASRESR